MIFSILFTLTNLTLVFNAIKSRLSSVSFKSLSISFLVSFVMIYNLSLFPTSPHHFHVGGFFVLKSSLRYPSSRLLSSRSTHSFQCIGFNSCITVIPPFPLMPRLAYRGAFLLYSPILYSDYHYRNSRRYRPPLVAHGFDFVYLKELYSPQNPAVVSVRGSVEV